MKIKKLLSLIAAAAMTVTALTGSLSISASADGSTDPSYFTVSDTDPSCITGYTGTDTDIVLPTEINGVKITSIGVDAFRSNTTITSVVVPEGYTSIGNSAFREATSLVSVSLPSTLETLGTYVFRNDTSLKKINIPEKITAVPSFTFSSCKYPFLVIDVESTSVTTIASGSFTGVSGLINVHSQEMYDLFSSKASSAVVVLNANMDDYKFNNTDGLFVYNYSSSDKGYKITLADNYIEKMKEMGTTELNYSKTTFNDGLHGEKSTVIIDTSFPTVTDSYTTSVVLDEFRTVSFKNMTALKKVVLKNSGFNIVLGSNFGDAVSQIEEVYVYAQGVDRVTYHFAMGLPLDTVKIYVTSEEIKQKIITAAADDSYDTKYELANPQEQIIVMTDEKPTPEVNITCEDINYGSNFNPQATVIVNGQVITDARVTYSYYRDEECTNSVDFATPPIGTYYVRALVYGTDDYLSAYSNIKKVEVLPVVVDKTALNEAITAAENFKNSSIQDDYDTVAWRDIYGYNFSLDVAKQISNDDGGNYSQTQVNEATQKLNIALDNLKKSLADTTDVKAELSEVITQAEALDENVYTAESYQALTDALTKAKTLLDDSTATKSKVTNAKSNIEKAINNLVIDQVIIPAGDPFAYVYKNGAEAKVAALTADEAIAGTSKIKLTFDCASDVSYNPNASIEVKAVVNGTESYEKFIGTDGSYASGTTDWTVELPLKSEIKSGDRVEITAFTYSWKDASDYVYAIKKVDFADTTGYILKTMTDKTVAQDKLAEAITKAEEIKADDYTAESVAELTKAIVAAKALTDEATAEEINKAITAIDEAIKGLAKKPTPIKTDPPKSDPTKQDPSKPSVNTPTNPTTKTTRSKEDVKKDKSAAKKAMKQAKISKLKVKSKSKKKINVTWKKVKKAKGYQVQVSAKKNFKKVIFKKDLKKTKLNIKNKKIKSKKTYYVRVRAYAAYKDANNKTVKVYSKWNKKLRKVKVK